MRKILFTLLALCLAAPAYAEAPYTKYTNVRVTGKLRLDSGKTVELPLSSFFVETGGDGSTTGTAVEEITTTSTPGYEYDDFMASLVWSDAETSPVQTTFRVPDDYVTGGGFRVVVTESNTTTPNQIDFDVFVNEPSSQQGSDQSKTGQTAVATDGLGATPDEVSLTVATDFDSLAAGDYVTLRLWRDDAGTSTPDADLEVKGVEFFYK